MSLYVLENPLFGNAAYNAAGASLCFGKLMIANV